MNDILSEKRKYSRIGLEIEIRLTSLESHFKIHGWIQDLSSGGFKLKIETPSNLPEIIHKGDKVKFATFEDFFMLKGQGGITWTSLGDNTVGIEFDSLDERSQKALDEFLKILYAYPFHSENATIEHPLYTNWKDAMKRNLDLIRSILFNIEEKGNPGLSSKSIISIFKDHSIPEINYHLKLSYQMGLIDAKPIIDISGLNWLVEGLTADGHTFVEVARNETIWNEAKKSITDKVGTFVSDLVVKFLLNLAEKQLCI